jgi:putative FmdB family regulatory protein
MPLYEYECGQCGRFEVIQKFSDSALSTCPTCNREVHKLLSSPAIQFKGTGWYVTDYAGKSSKKGETAKSEGGKSEGGKSESSTSPTNTGSGDSKS